MPSGVLQRLIATPSKGSGSSAHKESVAGMAPGSPSSTTGDSGGSSQTAAVPFCSRSMMQQLSTSPPRTASQLREHSPQSSGATASLASSFPLPPLDRKFAITPASCTAPRCAPSYTASLIHSASSHVHASTCCRVLTSTCFCLSVLLWAVLCSHIQHQALLLSTPAHAPGSPKELLISPTCTQQRRPALHREYPHRVAFYPQRVRGDCR